MASISQTKSTKSKFDPVPTTGDKSDQTRRKVEKTKFSMPGAHQASNNKFSTHTGGGTASGLSLSNPSKFSLESPAATNTGGQRHCTDSGSRQEGASMVDVATNLFSVSHDLEAADSLSRKKMASAMSGGLLSDQQDLMFSATLATKREEFSSADLLKKMDEAIQLFIEKAEKTDVMLTEALSKLAELGSAAAGQDDVSYVSVMVDLTGKVKEEYKKTADTTLKMVEQIRAGKWAGCQNEINQLMSVRMEELSILEKGLQIARDQEKFDQQQKLELLQAKMTADRADMDALLQLAEVNRAAAEQQFQLALKAEAQSHQHRLDNMREEAQIERAASEEEHRQAMDMQREGNLQDRAELEYELKKADMQLDRELQLSRQNNEHEQGMSRIATDLKIEEGKRSAEKEKSRLEFAAHVVDTARDVVPVPSQKSRCQIS